MVAIRRWYRMARGWHYTRLSLSSAFLLSFLACVFCYYSFLLVVLILFCVCFCPRWSFVDVPLIFFCPADYVPDWQPRILLGMRRKQQQCRTPPVLSTRPLHTNSGCGKARCINWSMVTCQGSTRLKLP